MPICVGCGLEVVDGILRVNVDGTSITCDSDGLHAVVSSTPSSVVIGTDDCAGDHQLLANKAGGGVQALHTRSLAGIDGDSLVGFNTVPGVSENVFGPGGDYTFIPTTYLDVTLDACSTSSVHGTTEYVAGGFRIVTIGAAFIRAVLETTQEALADPPAWGAGTPADSWVCDSRLIATGVQEMIWSMGSMSDRTWNVFSPGDAKRYGARIHVYVDEGNGRVENNPGAAWEIAYHYSHL